MSTLGDLLNYIKIRRDGENILLPNNEMCNIVEICDYLTISYLHTHNLCMKHHVSLLDMHSENIFIHWLGKNSYMGDKNIGNIKHIIYKVNNEYIKIDTHGFILKIGDIGSSIVHPRDDIFILGQAVNLEKNYILVDQAVRPNFSCHYFLFNLGSLPGVLFRKTIAYQILSNYPYSEEPSIIIPYELLDDMLTPNEMLQSFSKYFVNEPTESSDTLII
jgi:hypothetical protein